MNKSKKVITGAEIVTGVASFFSEKVKQSVIKYSEVSVLIVVGIFLAGIGVAKILEHHFSLLSNGFAYLLLALLMIASGMLLNK